jgi:hypothetical protein
MSWRILVNFIRQSMLKLKTHSFSGFHDLFLKHSVDKAKEGRYVRIFFILYKSG